MSTTREFRTFNSVALTLPSGRELYAFPIDGKSIFDIASVSTAKRRKDGTLTGFQREAVKRHIREIAKYIETSDAMIPNAVVVAFSDPEVRFEPLKPQKNGANGGGEGRLGWLHVPLANGDGKAAGWIVDGQQRTFAIQEAKQVERFPVFVCAFVEPDPKVQMAHFVNVNSTKPLPRDLVHELLPSIDVVPEKLTIRKAAARLAEKLAFDPDSPLYGMIRTTSAKGVFDDSAIQLNSLITPLEALLRDPTNFLGSTVDEEGRVADVAESAGALKEYWRALKEVFPHAWSKRPRDSRLVHGCGIWAMFHLMPRVVDDAGWPPRAEPLARLLRPLVPFCHWTADDGPWEGIDGAGSEVAWNGLQNTPQDKKCLTAHLSRTYRRARTSRT